MTDFEKTIKREMTREKFIEIRDHVYGDGKNTFNYTFGHVAAWFTWNRDEKGEILSVPPPSPEYTKGGHYYDGPIDNWDEDKLLPVERQFSRRITTDIVFIGLNMSGKGKPADKPLFQNARGHKRIVKTFFGTAAEGSYFTDIIKPDRRILDSGVDLSKANKVRQFVIDHPEILKNHIGLFKEELDFIGAKKPLLIVFGNEAEHILNEGIDGNFLINRFYAVVKIGHYSEANAIPGGDEGYKNDTRSKLVPYIKIPLMNSNLFNIMEQIVEQNGKSVLSEPRRVSSFLADLAKDEPKRNKNALIKCLEQGFPQTLKNVPKSERPRVKQQLLQRLHDEEGLDLGLCGETLDLLAAILCGDAPTASTEKPSQTGGTDRDPKIITLSQQAKIGYGKTTKPEHGHNNKAGIRGERDQIIAKIREKGYISTDDEITFPTILEVLNKLFDKGYGGYQRAVCHVDQDNDVWFPKLDYIRNGRQYPGVVHWHNYFVNNNQDILVQYPTRNVDLANLVWPPVRFVKWITYVFAKHEGSYRFFGTYEKDRIATAGELGLKIEIKPNEPVEVFKRINIKAKLPNVSKTN